MEGILPTVSKPTFASGEKAQGLGSYGGIAGANLNKNSKSTDAVEVQLRNNSAKRAESNIVSISKSNGGRQSTFGRLLDEVGRISADLESYKKLRDEENLSEEKRSAVDKEITALEETLKKITSKYDEEGRRTVFGEILDYVNSAVNSLNQNAKGSSILKAFSGSETLLGSEFNSLVGSSNLTALRGLQRLGEGLSSAGAEGLSLQAADAANRIRTVLGVSVSEQVQVQVEEKEQEFTKSSDPIKVEQITFETSEEIALGMKTMPPEDMIRAISNGFEFNAKDVLFLTQSKSDEEEEKDKNKEDVFIY